MDEIIILHAQQVTVFIIVPSARTSSGRSSVPTQATGATPAAKKATWKMIMTRRTMPAQLMEWIWTVRSSVTGIQWKAIAAITRDNDYTIVLVGSSIKNVIGRPTMPRTVIRSTTRRPNRSINAKFTKPKRKLVAPTTIETATGLLNPTMPNRVDE